MRVINIDALEEALWDLQEPDPIDIIRLITSQPAVNLDYLEKNLIIENQRNEHISEYVHGINIGVKKFKLNLEKKLKGVM